MQMLYRVYLQTLVFGIKKKNGVLGQEQSPHERDICFVAIEQL